MVTKKLKEKEAQTSLDQFFVANELSSSNRTPFPHNQGWIYIYIYEYELGLSYT